ncbi:MAG: hypothetical protein K2M07_05370 [Muribaculaceae bacterium]|nr:hypothetical protein [Muribaculaceae bacterium]
MKKIFKMSLMTLATVLMLGCVFTSCSKDDEPMDPKTALIGTWVCDEGKDGVFTYTFNSNGSGSAYFVWPDYPGENESYTTTWTATDNYLTVNYLQINETEGGLYFISSDGKTLTWAGDTYIKR